MLSNVFLGVSTVGAEWVLYLLLGLSIFSIALIFERASFFNRQLRGADVFRQDLRNLIDQGDWDRALKSCSEQTRFEQPMVEALLGWWKRGKGSNNGETLERIASDAILRTRKSWEKNLSLLATIGSNAPFIGLFGTVLGIVRAFKDLSVQAEGAAGTVTAGLSEALVATGVGIFVAIPAVIAFNVFQTKVRGALTEAEALQNFMIARLLSRSES